eukprot:1161510-Pelagomonas_calceolata.AAC.2
MEALAQTCCCIMGAEAGAAGGASACSCTTLVSRAPIRPSTARREERTTSTHTGFNCGLLPRGRAPPCWCSRREDTFYQVDAKHAMTNSSKIKDKPSCTCSNPHARANTSCKARTKLLCRSCNPSWCGGNPGEAQTSSVSLPHKGIPRAL